MGGTRDAVVAGEADGEADLCRMDSEAGESKIENIDVECWAKEQMT